MRPTSITPLTVSWYLREASEKLGYGNEGGAGGELYGGLPHTLRVLSLKKEINKARTHM